jgi:hypothetical protein
MNTPLGGPRNGRVNGHHGLLGTDQEFGGGIGSAFRCGVSRVVPLVVYEHPVKEIALRRQEYYIGACRRLRAVLVMGYVRALLTARR